MSTSVREYRSIGQIIAKQALQITGKEYRKYVHTVAVRMRQDNPNFPHKAFLKECFEGRPYQYLLYKAIGKMKIKAP